MRYLVWLGGLPLAGAVSAYLLAGPASEDGGRPLIGVAILLAFVVWGIVTFLAARDRRRPAAAF